MCYKSHFILFVTNKGKTVPRMKVADQIWVLGIIVCVTGMVHSQEWEDWEEKKEVIAFQARASVRLVNIPAHDVVKFDHVLLNEGDGYNGETGIFTAPDDGVYFFDWTITVDNGDAFHTGIVKNGSVFGFSYCKSKRESSERPCTATGRIKLKKGDKVWIRTNALGTDAFPNFTTFGGHRL